MEFILRDRSYRRHLAKQVAGLPCDNDCPEKVSGHAKMQMQSEEEHGTYNELVELAFGKFKRQLSHLKISSYELLAAHHDGTKVWYCDTCHEAAIRGAEENLQVAPCASCLKRRNTHVNTVHRDRSSFYGEDAYKERRSVPTPELLGWPSDYDSWFENYVLCREGGGTTETALILGAITVGVSTTQVWRAWQIKRHNDRMYEQGQANLLNADRSHALDLAKQWAAMSATEPSFEQMMQKLDELQASLGEKRLVLQPDSGPSKFWDVLVAVCQVTARAGI